LAATWRARNDETVAHHSSDVDGIAKGARYARVPHGAAGNHPRARAARLATQDAARTTEPRCASHLRRPSAALEEAGLVSTEKVGRVRTCKLGPRRLEEETAWLERYRRLWDLRFDELDKVVEGLKRKEKIDGRKKRE